MEKLDLPLTGLRVLDFTQGRMAGVGRHLGELGADVLRIEPPGGAAERAQGAVVAGISLEFCASNLGKRALALDLPSPAGQAKLHALLHGADIVIEDASACIDGAALHAQYPALVVLAISDFGRVSPFAGWQATGPVLHALSGELSRSGLPGRAPLLPPGELAHDVALSQAVFVVLAAYISRLQTGRGDYIDFSLLDAAMEALDPGYGIGGSATAGVPASQLPRGRPDARHQYPIIPCADGFVRICVLAPRQWQGMFEWLGRPAEFADPAFANLQTRYASPRLIPAIAAFFAGKTRAELEVTGQKFGVPTAAVLSLPEALQSAQMLARRAFKSVEIAPRVSAPFPDGLMEIDGVRAGPQACVPEPCATADWQGEPLGLDWKPSGERPLSGLRVLDLGVIVVGAEQGRLLADQGAEVIKVENAAFADGSRQTRDGSLISITFAAGHRNKKGLGLNLREPAGKALFLKLVAQSDVILSNFRPGTLESLGFDRATLAQTNPAIITVDSSAFGPTGPWSRRLGYGPLVRASAGLTMQWRYPGETESFADAVTVYPDHVAGRIGAAGVLALLIRRLRTGRGGSVSVSQAEVMLNHLAVDIAVAATGAQAPLRDAPWGVYQAQGADEWCVVTICSDAQFAALCQVMGRADLAGEPALAGKAGRIAQRGRIDEAVQAWLATQAPHTAMASLQSAGVPAAAMLRVSELPDLPHFKDRGLFRLVRHPHIAQPFYLETYPARAQHLPVPPERPAPLRGQHTEEIARDLLGLSESEITRMSGAKILETAVAKEPAV